MLPWIRCTLAVVFLMISQAGATVTTTSLASSANPSTLGSTITLTATVSPATSHGAVTFLDGVTILGTANLTSGVATLTKLLPGGVRRLTARYLGDPANNSAPSVAAAFLQTVHAVPSGGFGSPVVFQGQNGPDAVISADFNNDGKLDFAVYNSGTANVDVFLGNGAGGFTGPFETSVGGFGGDATLAVGDFDGDGRADLLVVRQSGSKDVVMLKGVGNGSFTIRRDDSFSAPTAAAVFDYDGDQYDDYVVLDAGNAYVYRSQGGNVPTLATSITGLGNVVAVAVGDFNGDGAPDFAIVKNDPTTGGVLLFLNDGTGHFTAGATINRNNLFSIKAVDLDVDGILDLVTLSSDGLLSVFRGNGDGTFTNSVNVNVGARFFAGIAIADLDGDGHPEIITAGEESIGGPTRISVYNVVTGTSQQTPLPGIFPDKFVAGDFSGDGRFDIVMVSPTLSAPLVYLQGLPVSTVTLALSSSSALYSQSVTLTATVAPTTATGTVTFSDGATSLGVAPVSSGVASLAISTLGAGIHSLTAAYSGDSVNGPGQSTAKTLTVNQITPTIGLTALPSPSTFGQNVTLTATVSPSMATGTVTFKDGSTALGTASLNGGVATLINAALSAGVHSLTAFYAGDANNTARTSAAQTLTVNVATPTISLTALPNPSTFGQNVTLTATVSPSLATGTVTFTDGSTALGTGLLNGGVATLTTAALSTGVHFLTAAYGGDANDTARTSAAQMLTVNLITPTISLTASLNPSTFGQNITLTATVSPSTAIGTVTFNDGSTALGTGSLNGGVATLTTAALNAGVHSLTATYGGDANDAARTSAAQSLTVNMITPTIGLTVSPSPSTFGQSVTLTATVSPSTATGTVTFKDGSTALGTGSLNGGVARLITAALSAGVHSLTATYGGDANDTARTSAAKSQTVLLAMVLTGPTATVFGQSVQFSAVVSPALVFGYVIFKDGTTELGSAGVSNSVATLAVSSLALGTHSVSAVYAGDNLYAPSQSNVLVVRTISASNTRLSGPSAITVGQNLSLTATVTPTAASGTVTFNEGANTLATLTIVGGVATTTLVSPAPGSHFYTATYSGDGAIAASVSTPFSVNVNGALVTNTTLTASANSSLFGDSVTLTASISPASAPGAMKFYSDGNPVGVANLVGGSASIAIRTLSPGAHRLTARYTADAVRAASVSPALLQNVSTTGVNGYNYQRNPPALSGLSYFTRIAQEDFNHDGLVDLVFADPNANFVGLSLRLAQVSQPNNLLFGIPTQYQKGLHASGNSVRGGLVAVDINGDGWADVVALNTDGTLSILLNLATGSAHTFGAAITVPTGLSSGSALVTADFNGDGIPDLAVSDGTGKLAVLLGGGDGTFQPSQSIVIAGGISLNFPGSELVVADFDGDGFVDLALGGVIDSQAATFRGRGDGTFEPGHGLPVNPSGGAQMIVASDINGDGIMDLVGIGYGVSIWLGQGNGNFTLQPTTAAVAGASDLLVVDMNGDGLPDILVAGDELTLFIGTGNGNFAGSTTIDSLGIPEYLSAASFNGGGRVGVIVGDGGISFLLPVVPNSLTLTSSSTAPAAGDSIVLTATADSPLASGLVTFRDAGSPIGTARLNNGVATLVISTLTVGSHSLTATFDDVNPAVVSPGGANVLVGGNAPTLTLNTSSPGLLVSLDGGASRVTPFTAAVSVGPHTISFPPIQAAAPGFRYEFNGWLDAVADSTRVVNVTADVALTATFNKECQLTTAVSPVGSGTILPASGSWVLCGSPTPILATGNNGYGFSSWTGPVVTSNNVASGSVVITAPATLTAAFTPAAAVIQVTLGAKSTVSNGRLWPIQIKNNGTVPTTVQITGLTLTQTAGTLCGRVIHTPFPVTTDVDANRSMTANLVVEFTGCASNALFSVTMPYTFSSGAGTGSGTFSTVKQTP